MRNPVIRGGVSRGVKRGNVVLCAVLCTYSKGKASRHLAALPANGAGRCRLQRPVLVMEWHCRASPVAEARSSQ